MRTIVSVGATLAAAIPIGSAGWWIGEHNAQADTEATEQDQIVETLQAVEANLSALGAIHVKEATVKQATEEAESALIDKLCAAGKLSEEECDQ